MLCSRERNYHNPHQRNWCYREREYEFTLYFSQISHVRPLYPREHNDINCNDNLRNFENSDGNSRGRLMIESKSGYVSRRKWRESTYSSADDDDDDDDDNGDGYITRPSVIGYCVFALRNAVIRGFNGSGLMISSVCQPANDYVCNCHSDISRLA